MKILIVGEPSAGLVNYLNSTSHDYYLITGNDAHVTAGMAEDKVLRTNFSDEAQFLSDAKELNAKVKFDCTLTQNEAYVERIALINKALALPGNSLAAARACSDKQIMRQLFTEYDPSMTPAFTQVSSLEDCNDFAEKFGYPCVIKAAGLAKSLLVVKVNDKTELADKYQQVSDSINKVYSIHFPNKRPKIIIEEFMAGSVHSVDAYADKNGDVYVLEDIVDCTTGYDIGADDNFHYKQQLPSALAPEVQAAVREVAAKGVKALGMTSSAAHVEIIVTKTGPKIVEIAARHGGKRHVMHELANGYNLIDSWIACNAGGKVEPKRTKQDSCVLIFLVPRSKGSFEAIKNHEALLKLPSLVDFQQVTQFGEPTGRAADGFKPPIELILHNSDHAQFAKDVAFIDENVAILVKN